MSKINIVFFSANRAEYSLIYPFLKIFSLNKNFNVSLIVAGSHLDKNFGNSFKEIVNDKVKILAKIKLPLKTDSLNDVSDYSNLIQKKINIILKKNKIDLAFLSSDRFETFAFASSVYLRKIPILHYEGGDITEGGALDDNIRHAITKLSNIHLTSNNKSRNNIIKMGEEKWRCINVGYSPIYTIKNTKFDVGKIKNKYSLNLKKPFILFTLHPIINSKINTKKDIKEIFNSLEKLYKSGFEVLITYPNFDPGYLEIIKKISEIKKKIPQIKIFKNLGRKNYHSLLYYIGKTKNGACMGNSSSGIKEAVIFNCPTINIGDRQKSRLKPYNVIDVKPIKLKIIKTVEKNLKIKRLAKNNPYQITKNFLVLPRIIQKKFKEIKFTQKKCTL